MAPKLLAATVQSLLVVASLLTAFTLLGPAPHAQSGVVKVTPLGSHSGEFCASDRALLFEDPTGVRILYDPGNTTDETDTRLGDVHAILLSHGHVDHVGSARINRSAPGSCAGPTTSGASQNTNLAGIAAVKNAAVFVPAELGGWMTLKIQAARGSAVGGCPTGGLDNITDVPQAGPCVSPLNPGGIRSVRRGGQAATVRITGVQAVHGNSIAGALVDAPGLPAARPGSAALLSDSWSASPTA